jgi:two-component system, OmpR family, phosphate regulon sensor histidine kinase PhoR
MAETTSLELLSFRRTFALLILLVVLPSAALSGFGVLAIINERAAVEKRLEAAWAGRLAAVLERFTEALTGAQVKTTDPLVLLGPDDTVLTESSFSFADGKLVTDDARLRVAVEPISSELVALPERPVFFTVSSIQGPQLLVVLRKGVGVQGARISARGQEALLQQAAAGESMPTEARLMLKPVAREAPEGTGVVQRLVTGVAEAKEAALGPREVSSAVLSPPLQDLRLVAVAEGEDPVAEASARNRTVYVALLVLFYLILAIGVVLTGRALYREAKLSRLKTDFVSLVSHELRTPLTSIRMFIETLAMGRVKDTQETQAVLDMLSKETARLSSMIENVLDWARIESGRKQYTRSPTTVVAVVETAVAAFRAQRVGAAMDFAVAVDDGLPKIEVDQEAVAGALLNLLQNAFKYTGEDKRIRLRARKDGAGVAIDVGDNGTGIAPRDKKRIFERFYRADNLLTRQTEGTGLGLSIAQRIAIAHHGKITVESTLGQGSTFSLHLPPAREVVSG